jgi:hypothetical protein
MEVRARLFDEPTVLDRLTAQAESHPIERG